jgi:DNA-binding transcriptional MerR regulator
MDKKRKYDEIGGCDYTFENKKIKIIHEELSNKRQKTENEYEQIITNLNLKNQMLEHELKALRENYVNLNKQLISLKDKINYYNNIPHYIS